MVVTPQFWVCAIGHMEAVAKLIVSNLDYDIAQSFCSHIVPKAMLWFTQEAPDAGM